MMLFGELLIQRACEEAEQLIRSTFSSHPIWGSKLIMIKPSP
ncbi:hypothetical protein PV403_11085 [Paenibacillus sp. GYB006]